MADRQHDDGPSGRPRPPASTYRLQLTAGFTFADAARLAGYLADLGVTHAYLSPILQAAPGSTHGYDVVDHTQISADLGGEQGFRDLAGQYARQGIGLVVDVVPNHMAVPAPEFWNQPLWSVLSDGQQSAFAHWFDVDWAAGGGTLLLPILAAPARQCLSEITRARLTQVPGGAEFAARTGTPDAPVLCYHEHVLPLRPGTERLAMPDLLAAQSYRLADWRAAATGLNWRRFFDISSLIAIRVEDPDVFSATHGLLLSLVAEGLIDGLRIDHPDGLADPAGYLRQLTAAAPGCWIVAEKILATDEKLPPDWSCAGTTGYDSLAAIGAVLTDPDGIPGLGDEYAAFADGPPDFATAAWAARREIAGDQLTAEVRRLARLLAELGEPTLAAASADELRLVLAELLAAFPVYRAYAVPGESPPDRTVRLVRDATAAARHRLPGRLATVADLIGSLLCGPPRVPVRQAGAAEFMIRFQQVCAATQAKGVEDTAAYRWTRLVSANEVGSDPDRPASDPAGFHQLALRLATDWPATMTTLSTHDTKRQEDVRLRLAALAESPVGWRRAVETWHDQTASLPGAHPPDPQTEYLLWQTLVGAWPIEADRLVAYLSKAMREAKLSTSWTDPDTRYEAAAISFARRALADPPIAGQISAFVAGLAADAAVNSLSAKLIQLTMPGVPDVYQGCELTALSLVDPDNRRPVDYDRRRSLLAALAGLTPQAPADNGSPDWLDRAKLLVVSRALRLRRARPEWFAGRYEPLEASGPQHEHVLAFARGGSAVTLATRLPGGLRRDGGWDDRTVLPLPAPGRWRDVITGTCYGTGRDPLTGRPGQVVLAEVTAQLPVALLVPAETAGGAP